MNHSPTFLIVGAGGIGGTVAAHLSEVGVDVVASTTNATIAQAVAENGFSLSGDGNPRQVKGNIVHGLPKGKSFDYILLATQPPQVEAAAKEALPLLAPRGRMVVFQNGLCEERVAKLCGAERVIGAIVAWGASMTAPGHYERTSSGGFSLGSLSGLQDECLRQLGSLLECVGPVSFTSNLRGARWSKLALNCCISSLGTMGGECLGPLSKVRRYRRLGLEIFAETVAVAKAEGVQLEKVAGTLDLSWVAISDRERLGHSPSLAAKHAMLLAVGMRYRRLRSSMLSAIERGRPPSIDFLNGEVMLRGQAHGIATPVNTLVTQTIHAIARGEAKSSRNTLDAVFAATRA